MWPRCIGYVHSRGRNTRFFYKQHFYKQRQAETGKKLSKAKQCPEAELLTKMFKQTSVAVLMSLYD